jgi:hypothetical protein
MGAVSSLLLLIKFFSTHEIFHRSRGRLRSIKIVFGCGSAALCSFLFFVSAAAFLQLVNHAIKVRIAGAKASGEPVAAALHHCLAIGQHRKLAGFAGGNHGIDSEPFFNQGHETRDLGFVVSSCRAGTNLDFHAVLQSI